MSKRRVSWPKGTRWLAGGIVAVVLSVAVAWVLFVPAADWLAHHDVGPAKGSLHETALDNARNRLLTLGAGLFAAGALVFTARNFALSREGQVTDRFTKAIDHLGSRRLDVRIGGIYALERVARDSARDHSTVMEVLSTFIREHSHEQWPTPEHEGDPAPPRKTRPDVQAAVRVIGRRDPKHDTHVFDLTSVILVRANLDAVNLTSSRSPGITFAKKGEKAWLGGANFTGATVKWANLTGVDLQGADFTGANLKGTSLRDADLRHAKLENVDLRDVDLAGANLAGANLAGVKWHADTPVPGGWRRGAGSGRLEKTGTSSG
jgi:hypothetical protein